MKTRKREREREREREKRRTKQKKRGEKNERQRKEEKRRYNGAKLETSVQKLRPLHWQLLFPVVKPRNVFHVKNKRNLVLLGNSTNQETSPITSIVRYTTTHARVPRTCRVSKNRGRPAEKDERERLVKQRNSKTGSQATN